MTYKENIKAILECSFAGFKEEIIDSACNRILEQEPCEDTISRQSAIFLASDLKQDLPDDAHLADMVMAHNEGISEYQTQLSLLPPVNPQKWIPVKWHNITEEEREREGYPEEWLIYMDCKMPDDGQEILITTKKGYVEKDICYYDDCYSLDSGYDWIDDVIAWRELPEPYNADKENKE